MKAITLHEAIAQLKPDRTLRSTEELQQYFVARSYSPIDRLKLLLTAGDEETKILFSGHRGSGKSTELAKLAQDVCDMFFVVHFTAQERLNLFDLTYVDVILSMGLELFRAATEKEQNIQIDQRVLENIYAFTREIITEDEMIERQQGEVQSEAGGGIGLKIFSLSTKLMGKLHTEEATRRTVREKVIPRLSDLFQNINFIAREIRRITGKRVLLIVEDLDKTNLEKARHIFYDNAATLTASIDASVIYTFPIALRHDANYRQITSSFQPYVLPNFKIREKDGTSCESGLLDLVSIITKTVEENLFQPAALRLMAELSGGVPRELIRLARETCIRTILAKKEQVDEEMVEKASWDQRNEFQVMLSKEQLGLLKKVQQDKLIDIKEEYIELLHNLSVLEYMNDVVWYDVHPLARGFIPTNEVLS